MTAAKDNPLNIIASPSVQRLLPIAIAYSGMDLSSEEIVSMLHAPDWEHAGKTHDWRNSVPNELEEIWGNLSMEARLIAYIYSEDIAASEVWD